MFSSFGLFFFCQLYKNIHSAVRTLEGTTLDSKVSGADTGQHKHRRCHR